MCNHPDLFEGRSIISAFDMLPAISIQEPSAVLNLRQQDPASTVSLGNLGSAGSAGPALQSMSAWEAAEVPVCGLHSSSPAHAPEAAHKHGQRLIRGGLSAFCVQQQDSYEKLMHIMLCRRWRHQACSFRSWRPPLSSNWLELKSLLR